MRLVGKEKREDGAKTAASIREMKVFASGFDRFPVPKHHPSLQNAEVFHKLRTGRTMDGLMSSSRLGSCSSARMDWRLPRKTKIVRIL